jgi:SAM-dependent methyltransferase
MKDVTCIHLFCGAWGLTHGLQKEGIDVVAGVDVEESCRHPFEFNNAAKFIKEDVSKISGEQLNALHGKSEIRVLAGCAPCQPFSTYSQRYDVLSSPRWGLLYQFDRLVKETRPQIVTMENVPTVAKHAVFDDFANSLMDQTGLLFFNHPDNLRIGKTAFPHSSAPSGLGRLYIKLRELPGGRSPLISSLFKSVDGVDLSKESIARARTNNPSNRYKSYDGQTLPYENNSFDMALAICVMHHVPKKQWVNFLSEMTRVVSPGGLICLIEHNPINPATRLSVARCPFDADAVLLGSIDMRRRLRAAGLEGVSIRHFVFFPSNKPIFKRIERHLHWLPLGAQYAAFGTVP